MPEVGGWAGPWSVGAAVRRVRCACASTNRTNQGAWERWQVVHRVRGSEGLGFTLAKVRPRWRVGRTLERCAVVRLVRCACASTNRGAWERWRGGASGPRVRGAWVQTGQGSAAPEVRGWVEPWSVGRWCVRSEVPWDLSALVPAIIGAKVPRRLKSEGGLDLGALARWCVGSAVRGAWVQTWPRFRGA